MFRSIGGSGCSARLGQWMSRSIGAVVVLPDQGQWMFCSIGGSGCSARSGTMDVPLGSVVVLPDWGNGCSVPLGQ